MKIFKRIVLGIFLIFLLATGYVAYNVYQKSFREGQHVFHKISYTREYGISYLAKYKQEHQRNKSAGFAVVNIPKEYILDLYLGGIEDFQFVFDSREFFNTYTYLSKYADNSLASIFFQFFENSVGDAILSGLEKGAGGIANFVETAEETAKSYPFVAEVVSFVGLENISRNVSSFFESVEGNISSFRGILKDLKVVRELLRSTESFNIGSNGNYFVIYFEDFIKYANSER